MLKVEHKNNSLCKNEVDITAMNSCVFTNNNAK